MHGVASAQAAELRVLQPADVHRIKAVSDISVSPDGDWVAYQVGTTDVEHDEQSSDLFMVRWDGSERLQLTHTPRESESRPRFSPDGRFLAFLASRGSGDDDDSDDPRYKTQIWLLNLSGGEAARLTELPGGVSGFEWSPDGNRLVLTSRDPKEPDEADDDEKSHDTPPPIVVDRYLFKSDGMDWLDDRRNRIYVFDIDSATATLLTPGPFDSDDPAWSPDGDLIAFTSKREGDPDRHENSDIYVIAPEPDAKPRQLTTWEGADSDPAFSPDGKSVVYLQGGPPKYTYYDPAVVATVPTAGGEPVLLTEALDRHVWSPRWSENGRTIHFLVEDDRIQSIAAIPARGGKVKRLFPSRDKPGAAGSFEVGARGIVTLASFPQRPTEVYRAGDGTALTDHNAALVEEIDWATVEAFDATSPDGVTVGSMLLKPPGYTPGKPYPTIALVHGGPVSQDPFEFDATSQLLAAAGYLVVNPNYRGSTGRDGAFSRAIYADWGNLEIQDIHAVMDKLVEDGLSDAERLGIGGWSYGGMNTNYAIATDDRFAAAVSGAAISNMLGGYGTDQYIWQYENELGLPWESIDAYLRVSYPFFKADRIKTPTLFMCGEKDFNVPLVASEQMYQALRSLNVPTQLVIYPGENHGLSKPSYIQDRLERMLDWYGRHMGPGDTGAE
ncbi:MAG: S9 family peptidase [Woeseiaceae bacterium]|nr:S9 family peptidase [Woeseiaceae bacterium]